MNGVERRQRGFTLIEIIVAVVVLAIGMGAAIKAVGGFLDHAAYLKTRTLAHWVAMNRAAELRLNRPVFAGSETRRDKVREIGLEDLDWVWEMRASPGPAPIDRNSTRIEIVVLDDRDQRLASLIVYLGKSG